MDDELCGVCNLTKPAHDSPNVNHLFSLDGQLTPKPKTPAAKLPPGPLATGDVLLRLVTVLMAKGVISPEEMQVLFVRGPDEEPRPQ